jgi:hypothetical protein
MNQANQKVVIQNTNMQLVGIRTFELNYFSDFFSNFGTQSAIMIGFIAGSISQVPGYMTNADDFWDYEYWITSSICIGAAIACVFAAFYINVFGQGLAIRGPAGSMIKTIEGMILEQQYIVILFSIGLFFFGLQCMGMYYLMFESTSAMIATIVTGIAIVYGYHEGMRLYNRFFVGNVSTFFEEKDAEDELNDLDPTLVTDLMSRGNKKKKSSKSIQDFSNKKSQKSNKPPSVSATKRSAGADEDSGVDSDSSSHSQRHLAGALESDSENESNASSSIQDIKGLLSNNHMFASYLTVKDRPSYNSNKEEWLRRYFLVRGHLLFYYKDKRALDLEPSKPINKRAINLEGYTLIAGGSNNPPYPISLVPVDPDDIRKVWKFRCDTSTEYDRWLKLLANALQSCNIGDNDQGDLIAIAEDGKTEILSARDIDESDDEYLQEGYKTGH